MKIDLERVINWFKDENNKPRSFSSGRILYQSTLITRNAEDDVNKNCFLASGLMKDGRICFGDLLDDITDFIIETDYSRTLITTFVIHKSFLSTACPSCSKDGTWMTVEEIKEHLDYPRKYLGLKYDFTVKDVDEKDYVITMEFHSDLTPTEPFVKFILFWFRYAFEYPYNLFIVDAYLLKERPEFKDWSLISLAQLTNQVFPTFIANFPPEYPVRDIDLLTEHLKGNKNRYAGLNNVFRESSIRDYSDIRFDLTKDLKEKYGNIQLYDSCIDHISGALSIADKFLMNEDRFKLYKVISEMLWK